MKVLEGGAGVATLSLLVKDGLRCTDLNLGAGRVQGKAFTSRAMPFVQATMHQETSANYTRLFEVAEALWGQCCPSRPPLKQCVRQVHKDFAPCIETARQAAFPNSRPCDDWFHLKQKRREMESRCKKTELRAGKYCKVHAERLMACLEDIRLAPTLPMFSALWRGMLRRLEVLEEDVVQKWLRTWYETEVPNVLQSKDQALAHCSFSAIWVGVKGIWPGTGSGNESAESLHSAWQRQLAALGGKGNVVSSLKTLQALYRDKWSLFYRWHDPSELRGVPLKVDPSLLNGPTLARARRSTAYDFCQADELRRVFVHKPLPGAGALVAMPLSLVQTPLLDPWAAQHGLQILLAPADNVAKCLAEAGVLQESVDGPPLLQLSMYKRILKEIAYVWVLDADTVQCTCRFFSLHAQCEHLLFARTQSWPGRPADLCFDAVPHKRKARSTAAGASARKRARAGPT